MAQKRLDRDDWLDAGLALAAEQGVGSVRLETLCRRLGVTKGSFYWHFENRGELIDGLLEHWYRRETLSIIDKIETKGGSPRDRLVALFHEGESGSIDFGAEQAIRHWARHDRTTAAAVRRVDERRFDYVRDLFLSAGLPPAIAERRAQLFNAMLLGEAMIFRREERAARRQRQDDSIDALLTIY